MSDPVSTEGQVEMDSAGATMDAPGGDSGQSVAGEQTTSQGTDSNATESFFDPTSIKGTPLESAYKQMQAAWTKKMQSVKTHQQKIDAYNAFEQDPVGTMKRLAQQYGIHIVEGGNSTDDNGEWQPKTWDEVMAKAKQEVMREFQPMLSEIQNMKSKNMEQYLDTHYSDWRMYEDDMLSILNDHPTLAKDPDKLYRMAVPEEVLTARATKQALSKIQGQSQSSQVSGPSKTTKTTSNKPGKGLSFNEAVEFAKARLAEQGIKPPH